jgi:hypothetical protein
MTRSNHTHPIRLEEAGRSYIKVRSTVTMMQKELDDI